MFRRYALLVAGGYKPLVARRALVALAAAGRHQPPSSTRKEGTAVLPLIARSAPQSSIRLHRRRRAGLCQLAQHGDVIRALAQAVHGLLHHRQRRCDLCATRAPLRPIPSISKQATAISAALLARSDPPVTALPIIVFVEHDDLTVRSRLLCIVLNDAWSLREQPTFATRTKAEA